MTLEAFQQLDFTGRLLAADKAVCIAGRDDGKHVVLLYQLNGFYIEVYYSRQHRHITDLVGFNDIEKLDPYLEKISLPACML